MKLSKPVYTLSAACLAMCLALVHVTAAAAHANYVRSVPEADSASPVAPRTVQVWFSEQVDPTASSLTVHDGRGIPVDNEDSHVAPSDSRALIVTLQPLGEGTYTVIWETLSAVDGHLAKGSFPFTVGAVRNTGSYATLISQMERQASALQPPPIADTIVRWLTLLALALVAGGFAYAPFAMSAAELQPLRDSLAHRRRRLLWYSLGLLLIALIASTGLRTAQTGIASALSGRLGIVAAVRIALLVALAVMLQRGWDEMALVALPGALLLLSQSALSHSAAEEQWLLPTILDWLHLTAAAIWLGGVAMLAIVVAPSALADRQWLKALGGAIAAFSPLAMSCVLIIYLTGLVQSISFLGSLTALLNTSYGRALTVKIVLTVILVGFGAFHQLIVAPALQSYKGQTDAGAQRTSRRFRTSILMETIISVVLLAAVGALTALPLGRDVSPDAAAGARIQPQSADDLVLMIGVTPSTVGTNQFAARLYDTHGDPVQNTEEVLLRLQSLSMHMGTSELSLQPYENGYFVGQSSVLSMDRQWQAEIIVRRTGKADAQAMFTLSVGF